MKIGILTFHRALNYGAVLQCYALKKTLQKCNVSVEVIDYRNKFIEKFYSPFYIEKFNIRKIGYMFYSFYSKCKRNIIFKQFRRDYLSLSNRTYNQNNISDADYEYNAIIVGSDQVWNFNLSDRDETYLLDFVNTARRFAYAASFGDPHFTEETYKILTESGAHA